MAKGKVVLVPFPFDDLSGSKVRPAVCLTDEIGAHRHIVLAFITSQNPPDALPSDVVFDPAADDFASTGLRLRSVLRLHRLLTVANHCTTIGNADNSSTAGSGCSVAQSIRVVIECVKTRSEDSGTTN